MDGPPSPRPRTLLMADDDADDRMMAERAWREQRLVDDVRFVSDGQELMDYLRRQGDYAAPEAAPMPALILLDLNMPRKDGRAALNEIKADCHLRRIPIVVLTTSMAEDDVIRSYDLGVSSFVVKPPSFFALLEYMKVIGRYWLTVVTLPPVPDALLGPEGCQGSPGSIVPSAPAAPSGAPGRHPKETGHGRADTPAADR